jgi:hypothetical protein
MSLTPFARVFLSGVEADEWHYSLEVNEFLGSIISPGDQFRLESSNFIGGRVEGDAASVAAGAWTVIDSEPGTVVFETREEARLLSSVTGFVALGIPSAIPEEISYTLSGEWLGDNGITLGPRDLRIFSDGFETGDLRQWAAAVP